MKILKSNLYFILILVSGFFLRLFYMYNYAGNLHLPNLGGDPCHHFNTAINFSKFFIPQNDFIFAYWFRHEHLPALIDIYPPGLYVFLGLFLYLFGGSYLYARIFNIIISLLNIFFAYLIGIKINSKLLGVLAALSVSINIFHIENSVILMNVVFSMLLIQIVILSYLYSKNWFVIGICCGCAYLTYTASNIFVILFLIFLFYDFYSKNISLKQYFKNNFFLALGLIIIMLPWVIINYQYFNSILYSHQNFYPFTNSFSNMMHETTAPSIMNYLENNLNFSLIKKYLSWSIKDIIQSSLFLTPTLFFVLSFIFYPLIFISFFYGDKKIKLFVLAFILIFFLNIIGSNANDGYLWPRHYVPILSLSSFLLFFGFFKINEHYNIHKNFLTNDYYFNLSRLFKNNYLLILIILLINFFTIVGLIYKDNKVDSSFWSKETEHFYKFGEWIKNNTNPNDKIMYGLTPQDAWCATNRSIIGDPTFRLSESYERAKNEIMFYNVKYLWIDLSNHIYQREDNINNVIKLYENIELKLIKKDDINNYYFYEIIR